MHIENMNIATYRTNKTKQSTWAIAKELTTCMSSPTNLTNDKCGLEDYTFRRLLYFS